MKCYSRELTHASKRCSNKWWLPWIVLVLHPVVLSQYFFSGGYGLGAGYKATLPLIRRNFALSLVAFCISICHLGFSSIAVADTRCDNGYAYSVSVSWLWHNAGKNTTQFYHKQDVQWFWTDGLTFDRVCSRFGLRSGVSETLIYFQTNTPTCNISFLNEILQLSPNPNPDYLINVPKVHCYDIHLLKV